MVSAALRIGWGEPTAVLASARNRPRANREIDCQPGGPILGSLIDSCSKVDDNPGKSGMKE